jgi:hypothetical protein
VYSNGSNYNFVPFFTRWMGVEHEQGPLILLATAPAFVELPNAPPTPSDLRRIDPRSRALSKKVYGKPLFK